MTRWTRAGAAAAGTVLLLGSVAACSGNEADDSDTSEPAKAAPSLTTTSEVGTVVGQLPRAKRQALVDTLGEVVDGWIDAAHVGGEWPRKIGPEAWVGFTAEAADSASRESALTSASEISEQVDSVRATKRVIRYDVIADQGRAVGATARVVLNYETTGENDETVQVRGRLLLTPTKSGWKIFGYDLSEGER